MNLAQVSGDAAINALCALANSGTIVFYSGTQPATPETALSGNTALVTWTFNSTAFGSASVSGGYAQASASFVASSVTPAANGTVTFARMYESNGTTVIGDFTVGTSGTDILIGTTTISTTISVSLSLTLQLAVS